MLRYYDFVPKQIKAEGFLSPAEYATFDAALAEANNWIKENNIRVVNIETVVLPNIWTRFEAGSSDSALGISGDSPSHWHQVLRVWYEVGTLRGHS
jgi:hypothetical protein